MRPDGVGAQHEAGEKAALDALYRDTAGEHWLRPWDTGTRPCEVSTLSSVC